ncbi:MAG: HEAT repeat domain-containing protein [Anaerolineales bacterium]|nr:HEAT repeat domain-containing protein [Anaerolineales bacterium]
MSSNRALLRNIIHRPEIMPLAELSQHPDAEVRHAIMVSLGQQRLRENIPLLLAALHDASELVRASAARALGKIADTQAIPPLIQTLQDPAPLVRASAAQALGAYGDPRCVPIVGNLLKDTAVCWEDRSERVCDIAAAIMQWQYAALSVPDLPRFDEVLRQLDEVIATSPIPTETRLQPPVVTPPPLPLISHSQVTPAPSMATVTAPAEVSMDEIADLWRKGFNTVFYHAIAIMVSALFLVMFVWFFSMSLRPPATPPSPRIEWIPPNATLSNYERIFDILPMRDYIINSIKVVLVAVPLTILFASWAGLAMALMGRWLRGLLVTFSILLLMVPITALWLPRYLIFTQLGLVDSLWSLIVPAFMGSSPLYVLLFFWSFRRLPRELYEAAQLDGASPFTLWFRVAMPLVRPMTITVGVLAFILYWSDFINPLLYLKTEEVYTIPVGLRTLQQLDKTNWPILMAASVVMTIPLVVSFLLVQRYIWPERYLLVSKEQRR